MANSSGERGVTVVLGASPRPDRYANRAQVLLQQHRYRVAPVNPAFEEVAGARCYGSITDVPDEIDTVTLYLGSARSTPLIDDILAKKPRRIIMNPGAENNDLARRAEANGIEVVEGCTLVMLGNGTY